MFLDGLWKGEADWEEVLMGLRREDSGKRSVG
jgi:hypothetical protein